MTAVVAFFLFSEMNYICLNGEMPDARQPVFMYDNRSYRYGDGLFETMRILNEKIILQKFHFERLFAALKVLRFSIPSAFTQQKITNLVIELCKKNNCEKSGRVRLSVFRGNGGLYNDAALQFLIECQPLPESQNALNRQGLVIDVYNEARKSCDAFSNIKSANYLPYVMAARYAIENKLNDCLLMNTYGNICEASVANVFLIKGNQIVTPALTEGCVSGVMRRYIIEQLEKTTYQIAEYSLSMNDVINADEVFLTNAVYGIKWVRQFRNSVFTNNLTAKFYTDFITPLFQE